MHAAEASDSELSNCLHFVHDLNEVMMMVRIIPVIIEAMANLAQ